jgi:hypothetical protein
VLNKTLLFENKVVMVVVGGRNILLQRKTEARHGISF